VIDEQHRFGVEQRAKLWAKNPGPAACAGDDRHPDSAHLGHDAVRRFGRVGHRRIAARPQAHHHHAQNRAPPARVQGFMRDEIAKGRQVYVVYPMIEETEKLDLQNLMSGFEALSRDFPPPEYQISIVHGKMKPGDKDFEMQRFVKKETQIMVATTVIEVGVNVPNASVMVIENAERFGLSQLHQLRGRVGRGADQSFAS
jgi:ATP-dependent DNA helicase RecG